MFTVMSFSSSICMTQGKGPTASVRLLNGCGHDSQMTTPLASLLHRSSDIQSNPTTTGMLALHASIWLSQLSLRPSSSPLHWGHSSLLSLSFSKVLTISLPHLWDFHSASALSVKTYLTDTNRLLNQVSGPTDRMLSGHVRTSAEAEDLPRPSWKHERRQTWTLRLPFAQLLG